MTKAEILTIGLAISSIAMIVDDATLEKIKPFIDKIENVVNTNLEEDIN